MSRVSKPRNGGLRASLACVWCRSQHAKCDVQMPVCSRCQQDGKHCYYAKSRRSSKTKDISLSTLNSSVESRLLTPPLSMNTPFVQGSNCPLIGSELAAAYSPLPLVSSYKIELETDLGAFHRLIDAYYSYFHNSHPYLISRSDFLVHIKSNNRSISHISQVIKYIGSLYLKDSNRALLRDVAIEQFNTPDVPSNGYTVLALLLLAIAIYGQDEFDRARLLLDRAIYMAVEIGMTSRSFANQEQSYTWAECWRCTYWGLYITDVLFVGFQQENNFTLNAIEADVDLPSNTGDDGPRTLEEYEFRDFEEDVFVFSSLAYLIEIVKISATLLGLASLQPKDREGVISSAGTMLITWKLHLPREKQSVVKENGEAILSSYRMGQVSTQLTHLSLLIDIHWPLSRLYRIHDEDRKDDPLMLPIQTRDNLQNQDAAVEWIHTKMTLEAVEAIVNLCALPIPIIKQSPLTIRCIASSTITSILQYQSIRSRLPRSNIRDKIRLILAVLNQLGEVWTSGRRMSAKVKQVARVAFTASKPDNDISKELPLDINLSDLLIGAGPLDEFDGLRKTVFDQESDRAANGIGQAGVSIPTLL